jgi:hypothetical protein
MIGLVVWIGNGLGKDARFPFFDGGFICLLIFWTAVFIGILWAAFMSFKRSLRPTRLDKPNSDASTTHPPSQLDTNTASPDERLAHLLKKP